MKAVSKAQISKIHVLLSNAGLNEDKKYLVAQVSGGRSESTRDLSSSEAGRLIDFLERVEGKEPMKRKVFALAYSCGLIYGDSMEDKQINAAKIDLFLKDRGTVKKSLNNMTREELLKTVNQFEQIVKHTEHSKAKKVTDALLAELNISKS